MAKKSGGDSSKLTPATAVKVRHILCEKHAKVMEAMAKLQEGVSFNKVSLFVQCLLQKAVVYHMYNF